MPKTVEGHEVSVEIEQGNRPLMVRQEAIDVLREEARRQVAAWLPEAVEQWENLDITDFEDVKDVQFKLGMAADALDSLFRLTAVPMDDDA